LLVVGLVGEYANVDRWKKHVKVFEMFVIIGVAGELFADAAESSFFQDISKQSPTGKSRTLPKRLAMRRSLLRVQPMRHHAPRHLRMKRVLWLALR